MARGRLLKTKVKEARKIAEATEIGKGIGQTKAHQKKPFTEELKEHIGKMIDRIEPLDIAAVAALTIIIKPIIQKIPDLANYMTANIPFGIDLAIEAIQKEKIIILNIKNPFTGEVLWEYSIPNPTGTSGDEAIPKIPPIPDLNAWIFSFAISVLIVRFGPELLKSAGGLQGLAKLLVGVPSAGI